YNKALTSAQIKAHYASAYGCCLSPTITVHPASLTNYATLPATFTVSAFGSMPLSYQWKSNGVPMNDGGSITGSTSNRLTFGSLTLAQAATYSVTVSNANGVTNSAPATLTVLPPPSSLVLITGLVLHLPFDNSLTDATTRGNNGTAQGNSSISYVSGKLGNALHYSTDTTGGPATYA